MTLLSLLLVAISEICSIAGQVFFKVAMGPKWNESRPRAVLVLMGGVAVMALGFFIWLGLLAKFDLSFLYPFDGLNRFVLLIAAAVFLKEKIAPRLWIGVLLISAGVALVASS